MPFSTRHAIGIPHSIFNTLPAPPPPHHSPVQTQQLIHIAPCINANPLGEPLRPPPRGGTTHALALRAETHAAPHAAGDAAAGALGGAGLGVAGAAHEKGLAQLVCVEGGAVGVGGAAVGVGGAAVGAAVSVAVVGTGARDVRGREAQPDEPPAAGGLAGALDVCAGAAGGEEGGEELGVDVEGVDAGPGCVVGERGGGVGDVGQAAVEGQGAGVPDEVVDGARVGPGGRGGGGLVGLGGGETLGDARGLGVEVEGAVERGEEGVQVAVEGGDAEGAGAVCEEEGVDEGAVLGVLA